MQTAFRYVCNFPDVWSAEEMDVYNSGKKVFDAEECSKVMGMVKAVVCAPQQLFLPVLHYAEHSRLFFPTCGACVDASVLLEKDTESARRRAANGGEEAGKRERETGRLHTGRAG